VSANPAAAHAAAGAHMMQNAVMQNAL
jgi:hypothetical protein